jgi:hypothetical protein
MKTHAKSECGRPRPSSESGGAAVGELSRVKARTSPKTSATEVADPTAALGVPSQ